ncbi:MAG: DUF2851 family protein [Candidatus Pacearchaeota archaeon]
METITPEKLSKLGEKWLETKIQRMKNLLKIAEPDEALYREIMLSLGYPKNKVQFLELALLLPFKEIKNLKERKIIEKALLYRAGFIDDKEELPLNFDLSLRMDKSVWEFKGIRPANYPSKRIKGISYLLAQTIFSSLIDFFTKKISQEMKDLKIQKEAKKCVDKIMSFQGIGKERKKEIFFNIILPFAIAYYENKNSDIIRFLKEIFNSHPPLSENSITKSFRKCLPKNSDYSKLNNSTKTYFGIHFYMKEYSK